MSWLRTKDCQSEQLPNKLTPLTPHCEYTAEVSTSPVSETFPVIATYCAVQRLARETVGLTVGGKEGLFVYPTVVGTALLGWWLLGVELEGSALLGADEGKLLLGTDELGEELEGLLLLGVELDGLDSIGFELLGKEVGEDEVGVREEGVEELG